MTYSGKKENKLLTTTELSKYLRVTPKTVTVWAQNNIIPSISTTAGYRFEFSEVINALRLNSRASS